MAVAAIWVIALVGGSALSEVTSAKIFVVLGLIPLAFDYARKNRPRVFDPAKVPDDVCRMRNDPLLRFDPSVFDQLSPVHEFGLDEFRQ